MIQAASVVRGQFDGRRVPLSVGRIPLGRIGTVEVPDWVANIPTTTCLVNRPNGPASCSPNVGNDTRTRPSATQFSNYPPLYYLIVGVPTLLATGSGALYGMRFTGALVDSVLIALGLFLLARYHPRRLMLLGTMIALSPMVLFISGVVSSCGMETAAAFAAWCGGLCVVERTEIPRALAALTSLSFVLLILSRPLSPINAAVMVAVLATLAGRHRSRALIREPSFRPIWISVLVATMTAGIFLVLVGLPSLLGPPEKPPLSFIGSVRLTLRLTGDRLRQCIGLFGWLDIRVPRWVVGVWTSALVGILAYGLAASRRCRRALPILVLAILAMPVILESPRINTVGTYWQGRYWLLLAVGLPLVASSVEPLRIYQRARSAVFPSLRLAGFVSVGTLLIVAQVGAFLTALDRYEGLGAKAGSPVKWMPPGGTILVVSLFITGQILLVGFLTWSYRDQERLSMTGLRRVRGVHSEPPEVTAAVPVERDGGLPFGRLQGPQGALLAIPSRAMIDLSRPGSVSGRQPPCPRSSSWCSYAATMASGAEEWVVALCWSSPLPPPSSATPAPFPRPSNPVPLAWSPRWPRSSTYPRTRYTPTSWR